jgi:hypothetical protein
MGQRHLPWHVLLQQPKAKAGEGCPQRVERRDVQWEEDRLRTEACMAAINKLALRYV